MMALFEFPERVPEKFLACFTSVRGNGVIWWTVEDSGRESQVKSLILCKSFAMSICGI